MKLTSINPYTNKVIKELEEYTDDHVEALIMQSNHAFEQWKRTKPEVRRALMIKTAGLLRENLAEYAKSITSEMGKPIKESSAEVEKCTWVCEYYAENAEIFLT